MTKPLDRDRAYSLFEVKAATEADGKRTFSGWATTPDTDRVNDVIDPMGAKFKNPVALLHQHNHEKPIGMVMFEKPTAKGIKFTAEIPVVDEPGSFKDRVDTAWAEIKSGVVRAVSIGFRALKYAWKDDGGIDFQEIEIYELSTVSIPANASALITSVGKAIPQGIKSFDVNAPAASGPNEQRPERPPRVVGNKSVNIAQPMKGGNPMSKSIQEQIAALETTIATKTARMDEIMQKSIDEGRSTDGEEQTEVDELMAEVEALGNDVKRLKKLEAIKATTAKPLAQTPGTPAIVTAGAGSDARSGGSIGLKRADPDKGIRFARYAKCLALSTKTNRPLDAIAEQLYGKIDPDFVDIAKAAVSAMTTGNTDALIGNEGGFADFVEFLRPMTVLGKFGTGNIPSLTQIPFRVPLITEASESDAQWVGEGKGKPLTKMTASRTELAPLKIATIAVQTMELIRDSSPSSDVLIRNSLAKAIAKRSDISFIDPTVTASAGVRPASILNGVSPVTNSVLTGADGVREDVQAIINAFVTANNPLQSGVWIMSATYALRLMMMLNPLGQREFPGITMQGGTFFELPVIVSNYLTDYVALVNAEDIWFADEGGVDITMSTEASLEMVDNPTQDSGAADPVETTVVSMFQTNSVAFRAERTLNWARRRASAVSWLDNVTWGNPATSP